MDDGAHLSETELARDFVQPRDGEHLPGLLHRCIPRIQKSRAKAYARLNAALRRSPPPVQQADSLQAQSLGVPHLAPAVTDYRTICANVTEDLKLASEAVIELRAVVNAWSERFCNQTSEVEVATALKWLDALQDLEEKKLIATVSLHALQRSSNQAKYANDPPSRIGEKVPQYAKELNGTDQTINELLQEILEYYLEGQAVDNV